MKVTGVGHSQTTPKAAELGSNASVEPAIGLPSRPSTRVWSSSRFRTGYLGHHEEESEDRRLDLKVVGASEPKCVLVLTIHRRTEIQSPLGMDKMRCDRRRLITNHAFFFTSGAMRHKRTNESSPKCLFYSHARSICARSHRPVKLGFANDDHGRWQSRRYSLGSE